MMYHPKIWMVYFWENPTNVRMINSGYPYDMLDTPMDVNDQGHTANVLAQSNQLRRPSVTAGPFFVFM